MTDWQKSAACIGKNNAIFYPPSSSGDNTFVYAEARAICATCSVREDCLEDALVNQVSYDVGMRGGTTPNERRAIRRERRGITAEIQPIQPCGTRAAYVRHRKHGEEPCEDCREANRTWNREDRRMRAAAARVEAAS